MCGRFYLPDDDSNEELQRIINQLNRVKGTPVKTGEVFPNDTVAVIANTRTLTPAPFAMTWGYKMPDGKLIINARSETATEKPMFRDGMKHRRCLLPASHYFEWEKRGNEKVKYAIKPTNLDMFYIAGLYRIEGNQACCTILTRSPADSISFIHDRMPVLLHKEAIQDWLNPKYDAKDVIKAAITDVSFAPVEGVRQMMLGE